MFLKKVVSWISENPPDEHLIEIVTEGSEKSSNDSAKTKTDGNWSSTSTRDKSSTLEGSFYEQNEIDIQQCNKKEGENLFADGDNGAISFAVFDDKDDSNKAETKKGNVGCDQLIQESLLLIRKSVASGNDDAIKKRDNADIATKMSLVSNCESQPSFLKEVSSSENYTTSDCISSRNVFTQTDESDKQRDNIITKMSSNCSSFPGSEYQKKNQLFPVSISSLVHNAEKHKRLESSESFYGALFVVGCSKVFPNHLAEKINTKYILRKRAKANGLLESYSFVTSDVEESLSSTPTKHVILYPSHNHGSIVVTFKNDSLSDLFQIGRYEKYPIDFAVDDISPLDKARHGVSRFACRISVHRDENHEARIYAGAFNSSRAISIGKSGLGLAHDYCGKMDGFTTNGVLIYKPNQILPGNWREVSVSGNIYPARSSKMDGSKRPRIPGESNILIDGTLIDLCGVTLIWRTPDGLKKAPSECYLNHLQSTLHKHVPESSLLSRHSNMFVSKVERAVKKAYVYLACGHVTGFAFPKPPDDCSKGWFCPRCRVVGPIKELIVGTEPGFYFDEEAPSYAAFKPCGHVATQNTVDFWSDVEIPNLRNTRCSLCPFCGQNLNFITKYVKLTLPII